MEDKVGKMILSFIVPILLIGSIVIFFFIRNINQKMNTTWSHQKVSIPSVMLTGEVIGWVSTRENFFLKIRLDNGNVLTISTDQAVVIPSPTTEKEKAIKKLEDELKSLKGGK
jgi:preprotein translocase subunit YajC